MRWIVVFIGVFLLLAGLTCASAADYDDVYKDGYAAGFHHGQEDAHSGLNFDFTHAPEFQSSLNYMSRNDCEFKVGYAEGYTDGFYGRRNRTSLDRDNDNDYDHDRYAEAPPPQPLPQHNPGLVAAVGEVIAYSDKGYTGTAHDFVLGRYPTMPEHWTDKIASMEVRGPVRVILFDDKNFEGKSVVVDGSTPDLGGFRHKAASMIIETTGYGHD